MKASAFLFSIFLVFSRVTYAENAPQISGAVDDANCANFGHPEAPAYVDLKADLLKRAQSRCLRGLTPVVHIIQNTICCDDSVLRASATYTCYW